MILKLAPRVLPIFVIGLLWSLPIAHYYVPTPSIPDPIVQQARRVPDESVLDELNNFFPSSGFFSSKETLITEAQRIVDGNFAPSGYPEKMLSLPPDIESYEIGKPKSKLFLARLGIPDILVDAYAVSKNDTYLILAKDIIIAFAKMEDKLWLDRGYIWNDHAVAERVMVGIKFWRAYRNHKTFALADARLIFKLIQRSVFLISKPFHYNPLTNHGIMQNLALLQYCIAFPMADNIKTVKKIAYDRFMEIFPRYLSDEGVILEHSAGYHEIGLEFIGKAIRYMTLLELPIPAELASSYEKAKIFYANLRRPDGSLPEFGDTNNWPGRKGPIVTALDCDQRYKKLSHMEWAPKEGSSIYPNSGYAVWWAGMNGPDSSDLLNQTVIVWSYFPWNAHKHADEMSFLLWADGQEWLTSSGYFPYGSKLRKKAISWGGSNAPHLIGESYGSERRTYLRGYIDDENLKMIDLERLGPGSFRARRQLLFLEKELCWLVVDTTSGEPGDAVRTIWNGAATAKNWIPGTSENSFKLIGNDDHSYLSVYIKGNNNLKIKPVKGSKAPFAGWDGTYPSPALIVDQPVSESMTITAILLNHKLQFSLNDLESFGTELSGPKKWTISLPMSIKGEKVIQRISSKLTVDKVSFELINGPMDHNAGSEASVINVSEISTFEKLKIKISNLAVSKNYIKLFSIGVILFLLVQEILLWINNLFKKEISLVIQNGFLTFWVTLNLGVLVVNIILLS